MNRYFALLLALLCASVSVASACSAEPSQWVQFRLEPALRGGGAVQASFRSQATRGSFFSHAVSPAAVRMARGASICALANVAPGLSLATTKNVRLCRSGWS